MRMKTAKGLLFAIIIMGAGAWATTAQAVITVPDYGDTGWQTWSHTFDSPFAGTVGIGVSNADDTAASSQILIDNLVGPVSVSSNAGFELGDFTGYVLAGSGDVVTSATAYLGNIYAPTEGSEMALLTADGPDTSAFGGTDGSWITFPINAATGDVFSFDWAFLAQDYAPYHDFAFLFANDNTGQQVYLEQLATITTIPEPATLALFGVGLLGLGFSRRRKRA